MDSQFWQLCFCLVLAFLSVINSYGNIGIRKRMIAIRSEQYGENRVHPLPSLRE